MIQSLNWRISNYPISIDIISSHYNFIIKDHSFTSQQKVGKFLLQLNIHRSPSLFPLFIGLSSTATKNILNVFFTFFHVYLHTLHTLCFKHEQTLQMYLVQIQNQTILPAFLWTPAVWHYLLENAVFIINYRCCATMPDLTESEISKHSNSSSS